MISLYGQICMSWYDVVCIWVLAHHWQWNEETIQRYMAAKKLALISQIGLECILYYNLYASTEFVLCLCWECNWIVSQFHSQICFWSQVALSGNTATLRCGNSFGCVFQNKSKVIPVYLSLNNHCDSLWLVDISCCQLVYDFLSQHPQLITPSNKIWIFIPHYVGLLFVPLL